MTTHILSAKKVVITKKEDTIYITAKGAASYDEITIKGVADLRITGVDDHDRD